MPPWGPRDRRVVQFCTRPCLLESRGLLRAITYRASAWEAGEGDLFGAFGDTKETQLGFGIGASPGIFVVMAGFPLGRRGEE